MAVSPSFPERAIPESLQGDASRHKNRKGPEAGDDDDSEHCPSGPADPGIGKDADVEEQYGYLRQRKRERIPYGG